MNTFLYLPLLFIFAVVFGHPAIAQKNASRQQTEFGAETKIQKHYPVPQMMSAEFETTLDQLAASLVDLNGDKTLELLVQRLYGANVTEFRFYRKVRGKWQLVLDTIAHTVWVEKTADNRFRRISIAAASAQTGWGSTYKFNGRSYKPTACYEEWLGAKKRKRIYMTCGTPK